MKSATVWTNTFASADAHTSFDVVSFSGGRLSQDEESLAIGIVFGWFGRENGLVRKVIDSAE